MKHLYLLLICFLVLGVGAQDSSSEESLSDSIRINKGENVSLEVESIEENPVNVTLESSYSEYTIEFYEQSDGTYESNETQVQNLTFGNYTVSDISRSGESLDYSYNGYIEVEDAIDGSGRQRWYNGIIVNDLTNREAAYIAAVPFSGIEQGVDGPITTGRVSTRYRVLALENRWLQDATEAISNLHSDADASSLETGGFYLSPQSSNVLPKGGLGGNTPNRERISPEEAEQYDNHEVEDYCYHDVAYQPPPYSGDRAFSLADFGENQIELQGAPGAYGGLESANAEPYSCPSISVDALPEDESELENPMTYCPSSMSESACTELRIRPTCEEGSGPICSSILGEGPGADAVLWQRYCLNQYDTDGSYTLERDEKVSCIGPNYNRTRGDEAPRTTQDLTHGEVIESFCSTTPGLAYNPENNICELTFG